jgi:hypothetical protein
MVQHTKTGKNIPNTTTNTKWPQTISNDRKIDHHHPLQVPQKITQIRIFLNTPSGNPVDDQKVLCNSTFSARIIETVPVFLARG